MPRVEPRVGLADLLERQDLVDDRAELPAFDQFTQLNQLGSIARHHYAVEGLVALIERGQVAGRPENGAEPSKLASGRQAAFNGFATNRVQNHIYSVSVGDIERDLDGVVGLVVDGKIRTELLQQVLVPRRRGGQDAGPGRLGYLKGKGPDASGPPVNEDCFGRS